MALIVVFRNDRAALPDVSNYDVDVFVNRQRIATRRVTGHRRSEGWEALVVAFAHSLNTPASVDAVDPSAAHSGTRSTRDA